MSGRWIWDIEADNLLPELTKIHCYVLREVDTGEVLSFGPTEEEQKVARKILTNASETIAHNGIGYDYLAVKKLHPEFELLGKVTDTLVLSRLIKGDLFNDDWERDFTMSELGLPKKLWGSHSLKAWGIRLAEFKGDYDGGFEEYSADMLSYCVQDTLVTDLLYKYLMKHEPPEKAVELEHRFAEVCEEIGSNGWNFDMKKATALYADLATKRHVIEEDLKELFEPWVVETPFLPKRDNKGLGYKANEVFMKKKTVYFNPNSRQHIHKCLADKYAWKPQSHTPNGQAIINESVLESLEYPEAKRLAEFFLIQKRISMLAEGKGAWMKLTADDGKLRHRLNSNSCISSRTTATNPNLQQVPSSDSMYGKECRELFTVPKGWWLCGADLSGIEIRLLAHHLHPYDNGEYAAQVLDGDVHSYNAKAFGVDRPTSKKILYSMIYGMGDKGLGAAAGGSPAKGKKLKNDYDKAVPAFATLKRLLLKAFERGYIKSLDQRKLKIRSKHRCLSQLLQSGGSCVAKTWTVLTYDEIKKKFGGEAYLVGFIHDEIQIACKTKDIADGCGKIAREMAGKAGTTLDLKISIAAEHSVGRNWHSTH